MTKHPGILPGPGPFAVGRQHWMFLAGVASITAMLLWVVPWPHVPTGLRATYFATADWSGQPIAERVETDVSTAALAEVRELEGLSTFSVDWSGFLVVRSTGRHRFASTSDDGTWVWVDDELVIDNGGIHPARTVTSDVPLTRGVHRIRVRYAQQGGESFLQLGQAGSGGRFSAPGPLIPDEMSYAGFRARELWALAPVLLWYLALGDVLCLALRRVSWFPHLRTLVLAASDRTFLLVAAAGLLASAAHLGYGLPAYESLSGDELAPVVTLSRSETGFHNWNLRWPPLHLNFIALSLQPFQWAATLFDLPLLDPTVHALTFLVIRVLSLGMMAASLLLTFDAALDLADRATGYLAVALLASMPTVAYFGSLANLEIPQMFWGTLAFWAWLKLVRWRDLASSVVFGAVVGLGLAAKDQLYGFYLLAPFALLYILADERPPHGGARRLLGAALDRRFIAVAFATAIGFAVGHQLPMGWPRLVAHVQSMVVDSAPFREFEPTLAGQIGLFIKSVKAFVWAAGVPASAAFLGGCVYLALSGRVRLLAALLLPLASYYVGFLAVILYVYDRFFIAYLPVAALLGAMCLRAILRSALPAPLRIGAPAAVLTAAASSAIGINLVLYNDPRHEARDWLAHHAACGSSVGITYSSLYVPPLDCYSVVRLAGSTVDRLSRLPDLLVFNEAYVARFERTPSGARFLARVRSGELGYRRVLRAEATPPRWAPLYWEERFWNAREDSETVLDKPLHAIEVWALGGRAAELHRHP